MPDHSEGRFFFAQSAPAEILPKEGWTITKNDGQGNVTATRGGETIKTRDAGGRDKVTTTINHPVQGPTEKARFGASDQDLKNIATNTRHHTDLPGKTYPK